MFPIWKGVNVLSKATASPISKYVTVVEVTLLSTNGRMLVMDMLNINISSVNKTPAIGALNIPAIAPAAPQPRRSVTFL